MKLSALNEIVKEGERTISPGSESVLLGEYNERMRQVTGQAGTTCAHDDSVTVPTEEAEWWVRAYERVCDDPTILDASDLDLSSLGDA